MAAIDKIYLNTYDEYVQFKDWCMKHRYIKDRFDNKVDISEYLYKYDEPFEPKRDFPVFCAPCWIDAYIIRECPLEFVQEAIMRNYGEWRQESIDEAYKVVMDRGGKNSDNTDDEYWYLSEDDFKTVSGKLRLKRISSYERIKNGELYLKPDPMDYIPGKHYVCTKRPHRLIDKPYNGRRWIIDMKTADGLSMYCYDGKYWFTDYDFLSDEHILSFDSIGSIRALKRMMIKWCLPVGTTIRAEGYYVDDDYEFKITK